MHRRLMLLWGALGEVDPKGISVHVSVCLCVCELLLIPCMSVHMCSCCVCWREHVCLFHFSTNVENQWL